MPHIVSRHSKKTNALGGLKMKKSKVKIIGLAAMMILSEACSRDEKKVEKPKQDDSTPRLVEQDARIEKQAKDTAQAIAELQKKHQSEIDSLKAQIEDLNTKLKSETNANEINSLHKQVDSLNAQLLELDSKYGAEVSVLQSKLQQLRNTIDLLEAKIIDKITSGGLSQTNLNNIQGAFGDHTSVYPLKGSYNTLVIPVEFASDEIFDGNFKDPSRFTSGIVQEEIFGNNPNSMHSYYLHASGGRLNVSGKVVAPVRVNQPLSFYGKAVTGQNDQNARGLVVDALKEVQKRIGKDDSFWKQFDKWDLNDGDKDKIFTEPDGFIDAVVLIYAGKPQNVCQRIFDPEGKKPGSDDIAKDDPRRSQAIECFNRIWPHRSSIFLPNDSPDFPTVGPRVEGQDRGALGYKITDQVFAFDYNMQSEYSDISTFIHEFGHSLTLPDVYALTGNNNVGSWDIMAQNGRCFGQELSAFHKTALGWISPKIVLEGESTSAYLGNISYVSPNKRESLSTYKGPEFFSQIIRGFENFFNILSQVPSTGEPVYNSLMVKMKPSSQKIKEIDFPSQAEKAAAYSGRFDNGERALKFSIDVPQTGDATLSFDTIYYIETETNFSSLDKDVRVVTDYDIGRVIINGEAKDEFRLLSGDKNFDSLVEENSSCDASRVLELRTKINSGAGTPEDKVELNSKLTPCRTPVWVRKSYDLTALKGKKAQISISYQTDSGYNEFGIFVDNIKLGESSLYNFEDGFVPGAEWTASIDGKRELQSRQFYLLEYRDPQNTYGGSGSYNMDLNVQGNQGMAMFLGKEAGLTPKERLRVITMEHQPGVLGWYFDSTFDRRSNTPEVAGQEGRGYMLPINNTLREVALPSIFDRPEFKDANGFYDPSSSALQSMLKTQNEEFKCFAYPEFAKYSDGKAPDCSQYQDVDGLKDLTLGDLKLKFRRDSFNNYLPIEQRNHFVLSSPGSMVLDGTSTRSAIQTFRSTEMGNFSALKVWKVGQNGNLEVDSKLTDEASVIQPMDSFSDRLSTKDAPHLKDPRFLANRAIVNLRGFEFKVVAPDQSIVNQYSSPLGDDASNVNRAPKAKILINWKSVQ